MGILTVKVLTIWSLMSVLTGLATGAVIQRVERMREEEVLALLIAAAARQQAVRWSQAFSKWTF